MSSTLRKLANRMDRFVGLKRRKPNPRSPTGRYRSRTTREPTRGKAGMSDQGDRS